MQNSLNAQTKAPLIGIICDRRQVADERFFHMASQQYIDATIRGAQGLPLLIPAFAEQLPVTQILNNVDGIIFTGSPSNVDPKFYGGKPLANDTQDLARDETTLPLLRAAAEAGTPILGICRGFQEMNVAFGGTLLQEVHFTPGKLDHRGLGNTVTEKYEHISHQIAFTEQGLLQQWTGMTAIEVNSLHHQGVRTLAPNLKIEATAPDGLVEAFSMPKAPGFVFGAQWHPEWNCEQHAVSMAIFKAFGDACRKHQTQRTQV